MTRGWCILIYPDPLALPLKDYSEIESMAESPEGELETAFPVRESIKRLMGNHPTIRFVSLWDEDFFEEDNGVVCAASNM